MKYLHQLHQQFPVVVDPTQQLAAVEDLRDQFLVAGSADGFVVAIDLETIASVADAARQAGLEF